MLNDDTALDEKSVENNDKCEQAHPGPDICCVLERIPDVPTDCRCNDPQYQHNRHKFVTNLRQNLLEEGRDLAGPVRFFDDGIVYEWVKTNGLSAPETNEDDQTSAKDKENDDVDLHGNLDKPAQDTENLEIATRIQKSETCAEETRNDHVMDTITDAVEEDDPLDEVDEIRSETMSISSASSLTQWHTVFDELPQAMTGINTHSSRVTLPERSVCVDGNISAPNPSRTIQEFPISCIDWNNYRKVIMLKRVPLDVTVESVYSLLLEVGFPYAKIQRLMLHTGRSTRIVSIQFRSDADATVALNNLITRRNKTLQPSWWCRIVVEPCAVPKRFGVNDDASGELEDKTRVSHVLSNGRPSTIGKRRQRDDDSDESDSERESLPPSRHTSALRGVAEQPSSYKTDQSRRSNVKTMRLGLHQESPCESRSTGDDPNPDSNEESNESTEYESPDSSENDSEETTPSHPRGTVLNSTPDGARLLHEITCCPMPRVQYGRPRRLLVPPITEIPMVAATMRADLQHIDEKGLRIARMSMPADQSSILRLSDGCFVGDTAFFSYRQASPQVSMVRYHRGGGKVFKLDLGRTPHNGTGVACITPMQSEGKSVRFLTGGYDKRIHLWKYNPWKHEIPAQVEALPFEHNAGVSGIAWRSSDEMVISASGNRIWSYSVSKGLLGRPDEISNPVHQVHLHPHNPNVAILEVAHLDRQILVYDIRRAGFNQKPSFELGIREADHCHSTKSRSRRGDTSLSYFVRGYQDGTVAMWDYRNPKAPVLSTNKCKGPVWHTVFTKNITPSIWAYAERNCVKLSINAL